MSAKTLISTTVLLLGCIVIASVLKFTLAVPTELQTISKLRIVGNTTYVIDSSANALFFGTQDNITANSITTRREINTEVTEVPFNALLDVTVLQNGNIYLIDGIADGIFEYAPNGSFSNEHTRFSSGSSITEVKAITSDYNDNVYALQYDDGYKILMLGAGDEYFSVLCSVDSEALGALGVQADESALLACDFENQVFYITSNGTLIKVQEGQASALTTYAGNATDIAVDYLGNPYVSLDNGTILKYQGQAQYLELQTNTISLNFENGDITYAQGGSQIQVFSSNFVNNLSRFQHPIDYTAKTSLTSSAEIYEVVEPTDIFKYPLKVSQLNTIEQGALVIKLADSADYPQFTYILTTVNGSLCACYIQTSALSKLADTPLQEQMRTYTKNTRLYKYPTADFYQDSTALFLTMVPQATQLDVVGTACNFADSQGRTFYEVIYNGNRYYAMQSMLTTLATEEGTVTLNSTNAYLDSKESVYIYAGVNSANIVGVLPAGAKFYVNQDNFDTSIDRTYIEYLDENNNYITGFIDTELIAFDEISPFVILGIILLLVVLILILILILYFAKEHKNKNK